MFQLPSRFTELVLEHRHSDGSWSSLERVHHDPADHDVEREWKNGAVFVCTACEEQVRVGVPDETGDDAAR